MHRNCIATRKTHFVFHPILGVHIELLLMLKRKMFPKWEGSHIRRSSRHICIDIQRSDLFY